MLSWLKSGEAVELCETIRLSILSVVPDQFLPHKSAESPFAAAGESRVQLSTGFKPAFG